MASYGKYPYITLNQVKNYLSITSSNEDSRLSNLMSYACSVVENYIGFEVLANNYSEVFDGGRSSVFVSRLPLQKVYTLTEYDGYAYRRLANPQTDGSSVTRLQSGNAVLVTNGGPVLKSRFKKFGDSSAFFNGSTDYLSSGDSDNWYFGDSPFTIDLQIRANSYSSNLTFISQTADSNNYWSLGYNTTNGYNFRAVSSGTEVANVTHANNTGYTSNTFHHVEIARSGSTFKIYRDGIELGTQVTSNVMPDINGSLEIGRQNVPSSYNYYNGFIDELRISHVARHTDDFTPPTYQHSTDDNTVLLVHFDGPNDTAQFSDEHATVEQFIFYPVTGEITRNVGENAGFYDLSLVGAYVFKNFPRGVKVDYRSGYEAGEVPYDLSLATLDYVKMLHKDRQESQGFTFQGENVQDRTLSSNFPPHIKRILDLYRIPV
jgi:hypothetical protein